MIIISAKSGPNYGPMGSGQGLGDWLTWLMFGGTQTIHHRQASCVSDASRYSTLAPAHWTCMALEPPTHARPFIVNSELSSAKNLLQFRAFLERDGSVSKWTAFLVMQRTAKQFPALL